MSNVVPPIFLRTAVLTDGGLTHGKIIALSARKLTGDFSCPYCGTPCADMVTAGKFVLLLNDSIRIRCRVGGCEHCKVFVYSPRHYSGEWSAEDMRSIEPIDFVPNQAFWSEENVQPQD